MQYIVPAVAYKDEIIKHSDILRYSEKMLFYNGCYEHGRINIETESTNGRYQWAIVDKDNNLVGYISYQADYYSGSIYSFGLINFTDNHAALTAGVLQAVKHIKSLNPHRIEWRCVSDNPACIRYSKIVKRFGGRSVKLHDVFKDTGGRYHDEDLFEIIFNKKDSDEG